METSRAPWSAEDEQKCVRALELFCIGLTFEFRPLFWGSGTVGKFRFAGNEQRWPSSALEQTSWCFAGMLRSEGEKHLGWQSVARLESWTRLTVWHVWCRCHSNKANETGRGWVSGVLWDIPSSTIERDRNHRERDKKTGSKVKTLIQCFCTSLPPQHLPEAPLDQSLILEGSFEPLHVKKIKINVKTVTDSLF